MDKIEDVQPTTPFIGLGIPAFLDRFISDGDDYDDDKCWVIVPEF